MTVGLGRLAAVAAACAAAALAVLAGRRRRAADSARTTTPRKYEADGGAAFYAADGRRSGCGNRCSPFASSRASPRVIPDQDALDKAVANADRRRARGRLRRLPVSAARARGGRRLAGGASRPWLTALARRVSAREPVRRRQRAESAGVPAAAVRRRRRAASRPRPPAGTSPPAYDALKAVDPGITVVGVGLSPRGNDDPTRAEQLSVSPLRFLEALGRWYRASGRTAPLMDGFSFHPYPRRRPTRSRRATAGRTPASSTSTGSSKALWDAFHGTAQPTTVDGLKLYLDEVGWQVDTTGRDRLRGRGERPGHDRGEQAAIYGALVRQAACDPAVAEVNFFGFHDDGLRTGLPGGALPRGRLAATRRRTPSGRRSPTRRSAARACRSSGRPRRASRAHRPVASPFTGLFGPVLARTPLDDRRRPRWRTRARPRARSLTRLASPDLSGVPHPAREPCDGRDDRRDACCIRPAPRSSTIDLPRRSRRPGRYVVSVRFTAEARPARARRSCAARRSSSGRRP